MNNKFSLVAVVVAVLCMMTSCLNDDSTNVTTYDDVAVTSFTLGTLKKIVYTKRNGKDSTYATTASCSSVRFTVDNVNNIIYNVDSLTRGIVTSKALVTVSAKNSGYAYLKDIDSDTLRYISSTDSLDFSQPRTMRVVANSGAWYKDYTVEVRVHKEPRDSVYWSMKTVNDRLGGLDSLHALCFGGNMIVYGIDDSGAFSGYTSAISDGSTWTKMSAPFGGYASLVTDSTTLYACSNGKVYTSTDNSTWTEQGTNKDIKTLAAATKTALYAVANDGRMLISADGGATWTDDAMADDKRYMPAIDIVGAVTTTTTNSDINTISLFGNTGAEVDSTGVMWSKIVDNSLSSYTQPWQYHQIAESTTHRMPALTNMNIIRYAEGFIMIGGAGRGACTETALDKFWLSEDYGLTWWKDKRFYFPDGCTTADTNFALAVDSDKYMWLVCGGTGQVWRGRLTQMTWTNK